MIIFRMDIMEVGVVVFNLFVFELKGSKLFMVLMYGYCIRNWLFYLNL